MLTILGDPQRFCDGVSRRTFLKIGGLALGGLSMPQILSAESLSGVRKSHKAVIMIYLPGGPPHQDLFDIKTEAPSEIRGPIKPIKTNVSGIEICEYLPRVAKMMDKFVAIRTVVGSNAGHSGFQCMTGRGPSNQPPGGWPSLGSILSKLEGHVEEGIPPAMALTPITTHKPYSSGNVPGFLGPAHTPFKPTDQRVQDDLILKGTSLERLRDRRGLLTSFDRFRHDIDRSGVMESLDASHQQAFGILTSSRLAEAFDLEKEDTALRDRYGRGSAGHIADAAPGFNDQFLLARRLVEAGARCVTLAFAWWDWHHKIYQNVPAYVPRLDQGIATLVEDLHNRGMDKDVSVVVWGEFGRTPWITGWGGRDHWTNLSCALLAGGGMNTGQVIGTTDKDAAEPKDRPVHFQEVFATLYHNLGINVQTATVPDLTGRPQHLVESQYKPMPELI